MCYHLGVKRKSNLTICTVSYNSKSCIHFNWTLSSNLNENETLNWIIIENSPDNSTQRISNEDGRFIVVEGGQIRCTSSARGSYHHASGLNFALDLVDSRYVLFIDPDFFIIRPDWIQGLLTHMQANKLSFWGAPYYPSRYTKYRYFPCGLCLLVDLERVEKSKLNFTPEIDERSSVYCSVKWKTLVSWVLTGRPPKHSDVPPGANSDIARSVLRTKFLMRLLGQNNRLVSVGNSRDLGYKIYREFSKNSHHRSECIIPVWNNPLYDISVSVQSRLKRLIMRWFLPESLSPYPKRKSYSYHKSFRDFRLPDIAGLGWEEYIWKGEPFGFHISGLFQGKVHVENVQLEEIIAQFIGVENAA